MIKLKIKGGNKKMEQENTKNSRENGIKNNLLIKSKKELKGITLIALVITIIVLKI